jgi:hypothetical protein
MIVIPDESAYGGPDPVSSKVFLFPGFSAAGGPDGFRNDGCAVGTSNLSF